MRVADETAKKETRENECDRDRVVRGSVRVLLLCCCAVVLLLLCSSAHTRPHHREVERIELGRVVQTDHSDTVLNLQLNVAVEEQRRTAHVAGGMAKARGPR